MAQLEFTFVHALDRVERGIPNIERKIAESPGWFAQVVALACEREDDGQDPLEWRVDDSDRRTALGDTAYRLLTRIRRMPGAGAEGKVKVQALHQWVTEVRRFCGENGRAGVGDRWIGEFLSRAPSDEDGSWPCRPVCEVLESIASGQIASGFEIGVYNARGAHWRGLDEGGKQERELSTKYRAWAQRLAFDYRYVTGILERIAQRYDRDAQREDSEVRVMKRLEH